MTTLSQRVRPGVEAAPWVIDEIRELELTNKKLMKLLADASKRQTTFIVTPPRLCDQGAGVCTYPDCGCPR